MVKLSNSVKETLPEFQKFLLNRKLVPERNAPFYAYWVSRFLEYARKRDLSTMGYQEPAVMEFLDVMRADKRILFLTMHCNQGRRKYPILRQRISRTLSAILL